MAVGLEALESRRNSIRSSIVYRISVWFALSLLCLTGGREEGARADGTGPRSDDWITVNKDYSGQRYVDLDQITPNNVANLTELCELQLNEPANFSSGLLKIGRTIYVTTGSRTVALDAVTCDVRWQKVEPLTAGRSNARGAGYSDGKIFRSVLDGRLIARDAATGQFLWQTQAANTTIGEHLVSAPIAWKGKVFVGLTTSDTGIAGRMMAFDANTGNQLWQFETTFGQPAGGGFWTTYSLDPTTGEVFLPIVNPYPTFDRDITPGDIDITKLTDSVASLDSATGHLNWYYQLVPGDDHDWDQAAAPTLYRASNGERMVAAAGKSGRVYAINRATQLLAFDTPGEPLNNDQVPLSGTWLDVCPGINGGAMFNGAAYDPTLGALYVGMVDFCTWYVTGANFGNPTVGGKGGAFIKDWASAAKQQAPTGWITAIDATSGRALWQYHAEAQTMAGLLPTKSGLLLAGDSHGHLLAFNKQNGALLASIDTGGALNNGLISYAVGGQQYVAATVGGGTENPSTVAGPLRVSVYGLGGSGPPKVITLDRLDLPPPAGETAGQALFGAVCGQCHGSGAAGSSAPPLFRQSQLADPALLKQFLMTVPPPMPHLYPGVLIDKDVEAIAEFLRTSIFKCGPNEPQSCKPPPQPHSGGTAAWQAVYSVLTSPRCINCHPVASPNLPHFPLTVDNSGYEQDYPRQGDDRHPHYYAVLRGGTVAVETSENTGVVNPGIGAPFERCTFCHGAVNDPVTGIPGTTNPAVNPGQPFG